jgi:hypothetical protein
MYSNQLNYHTGNFPLEKWCKGNGFFDIYKTFAKKK